jgi:drug/metabolite transporter (DMT)-like permease
MNYYHLFCFVLYSFTFFLFSGLACLTIYTGQLAGINVGVISILWRMNVLMMAIADYFINGQKLKLYHGIGMVSVLASVVCIGFSKNVNTVDPGLKIKLLPMWVPIVIGIASPFFMTVNTLMVKHMTKERIGFNASRVTFNALIAYNTVLVLLGIPYWVKTGTFTMTSLYWGLLGGIIGGIGFGFL